MNVGSGVRMKCFQGMPNLMYSRYQNRSQQENAEQQGSYMS